MCKIEPSAKGASDCLCACVCAPSLPVSVSLHTAVSHHASANRPRSSPSIEQLASAYKRELHSPSVVFTLFLSVATFVTTFCPRGAPKDGRDTRKRNHGSRGKSPEFTTLPFLLFAVSFADLTCASYLRRRRVWLIWPRLQFILAIVCYFVRSLAHPLSW